MMTKERSAAMRRLTPRVVFAFIALSLLIMLQGCAEDSPSRKSDEGTSFSIEATDKIAPENGRSSETGNESTQSSEASRESEQEIARSEIDALIEPYGSNVAISLASLEGAEGFDVNGDVSFVSASMIKLLVLACLMDEVRDGALSLEQTYELSSADIVGGTGRINALPLGTALSYDELAESMIAYSDNTATNVLIDALGMDAINMTAKSHGLTETRLQRKMMDFSGSAENYMSTNDAVKLLTGFANGDIGNTALSEKAIGYLNKQTDNAALAQGIPEGIVFAHKTGSLNEFRHDGGIVYATRPYVLVVFTSLGATADGFMANISAEVYATLES